MELKDILNANEDLETKDTMLKIKTFEDNLSKIANEINNNTNDDKITNDIINSISNDFKNKLTKDLIIFSYDDLYVNIVNYDKTNGNIDKYINDLVDNEDVLVFGNITDLKKCYFVYVKHLKFCFEDVLIKNM